MDRGTERMLALLLLPALLAAAPGEDFAKRYPASMSHSNQGLTWTCGPEDVWQLKSFEFKHGSELQIQCKKSVVVFGVHKANVLWAMVYPDKPVKIRSKLPGGGEFARSILLRFAPKEVGRLFPSRGVTGPGPAWRRVLAGRAFRHKVGYKWSTPAGNPTIVPAGWYLVDIDTDEGKRRFYAVDKNSGSVEYVAEFENKLMPPLRSIAAREATQVYDEVWEAFDREYAMFGLLPDVNWAKLGKQYRKVAAKAPTTLQLGAVLSDLLAHLQDLHVWVKAGDDFVPGYTRERPGNGNWQGSVAQIGSTQDGGKNLTWGRTSDGLGYLNVSGLSDQGLPDHVDRALEALADTWGLILDLRFNGGGDEVLAMKIAGRFLDETRVYSLNQYRNGPKHHQLGPVLERRVEPRGPWRYQAPVVALWGQRTMSSAESLALMLAQCPEVTTMGDRSAGSSANPRRLSFDCGIAVNMPRWIDMDPEGQPIERVGIEPEVLLNFPADQFTAENDPVLEAALEHLRKLPKSERTPARPAD